MSCSGCYSKFGAFRREKTCDKCSLSFCSKCLMKNPIADDNERFKFVCKNCTMPKAQEYTVPDFSETGLKVSKNIDQNGGSKVASSPKHEDKISDVDEEIRRRLEKLKEGITTGTHENIDERLAKLKGETASSSTENHNWLFKNKPKKTQAEETSDLLKEFEDESKISSKIPSPEEEIARRLAKLKGETFVPDSAQFDNAGEQDPNEFLKSYDKSHDRVDFIDDDDKSLDEIHSNLRQSASDHAKLAEVYLIDQEIKDLMTKYNNLPKTKATQGEKSSLPPSDDETDESEVEQVIEQVLMAKDDEDELDDDTTYQGDSLKRQTNV